jgi:hypothetical protein
VASVFPLAPPDALDDVVTSFPLWEADSSVTAITRGVMLCCNETGNRMIYSYARWLNNELYHIGVRFHLRFLACGKFVCETQFLTWSPWIALQMEGNSFLLAVSNYYERDYCTSKLASYAYK